ncbi:MAG: hypothetical protein ABSD69_02395 [Candidatus Levyibacteriota bacterium]|jgi:hypothetical protein
MIENKTPLALTRDEILLTFPPKKEIWDPRPDAKAGVLPVEFMVSRDEQGVLRYATPVANPDFVAKPEQAQRDEEERRLLSIDEFCDRLLTQPGLPDRNREQIELIRRLGRGEEYQPEGGADAEELARLEEIDRTE